MAAYTNIFEYLRSRNMYLDDLRQRNYVYAVNDFILLQNSDNSVKQLFPDDLLQRPIAELKNLYIREIDSKVIGRNMDCIAVFVHCTKDERYIRPEVTASLKDTLSWLPPATVIEISMGAEVTPKYLKSNTVKLNLNAAPVSTIYPYLQREYPDVLGKRVIETYTSKGILHIILETKGTKR